MDYNNPLSPWNQRHYDDKMYDDMTDEEKMKVGCLHLFVVILMFFVGIGLCCLFGSCTTTKYVPVVEYHTDTLYQNHVQHDSIHVRDSVDFHEYVKGDTVTIEKWHWRDRWRDRVSHDTIYQSKTDTVTVEAVPRHTEKLTKWQKTRIKIANWLLWAVGALVVAIVARFVWRMKR